MNLQFIDITGENRWFSGIVNARDLGGYKTTDGRMVKPGLLIRGASLATAKDTDLALLSELHAVKVIDFRTDFEKRGKENRPLPGTTYICLPIQPVDSEDTPKEMTQHKTFDISKLIMMAAFNEKAKAIAREMYPSLVMRPDCQRQFAAFLREVVETQDGAVYFHCTQGKDRTGFASAYLLSALGVDRETVIADFDKTNLVYAKDVRKYCRKVRFLGGKEEELAVVKAFIGANTDNFIKALDLIDAEYGSMDVYLRKVLGLTETDFETLKERYLIPV
jgi:protein-tyrosine phosphatase